MESINTTVKGKRGEDIAVAYLKRNGFEIIKRNFHFGRNGEIDIIAELNSVLVFVEVKMRSSDTYGDPLLSINFAKQKSLRKTAEGFLYINKIIDKECRFDIITIDVSQNPPRIDHLVNAM